MNATPILESTRYHGLDALRGGALLLGVLLHAIMPYVLPPGFWAVGTTSPDPLLGWLAFYLHSFRMEIFFLLAGFFAALVIGRKGTGAYLRDRCRRILLVFLVALYPMKFLLTSLWIEGGRVTGWLTLPPEAEGQPWWVISLGGLSLERWPTINLTHLWFLYYLSIVLALFLLGRWLVGRAASAGRLTNALGRGMGLLLASGWAPWTLALAVTPLLARMRGMDVDTPDSSFAWNLPVLALYGLCFALGWTLSGRDDLLAKIADRWRGHLLGGLLVSGPASILVGMRYSSDEWVLAHADLLRWLSSAATSLTMGLTMLGWLGFFLARSEPSPRWRYLADASYWIYLAHLPVVVSLQVGMAPWALPWWLQVPAVLAIALGLLLAVYHWAIRPTWVGAWLNGRARRPEAAASGSLARAC